MFGKIARYCKAFLIGLIFAVLSDSASTEAYSGKLCFTRRAVEKLVGLIPRFLSQLVIVHFYFFNC